MKRYCPCDLSLQSSHQIRFYRGLQAMIHLVPVGVLREGLDILGRRRALVHMICMLVHEQGRGA